MIGLYRGYFLPNSKGLPPVVELEQPEQPAYRSISVPIVQVKPVSNILPIIFYWVTKVGRKLELAVRI